MRVECGSYGDDRALGAAEDFLGDGTKDEAADTSSAMRSNDDHIDFVLVDEGFDLWPNVTTPDHGIVLNAAQCSIGTKPLFKGTEIAHGGFSLEARSALSSRTEQEIYADH